MSKRRVILDWQEDELTLSRLYKQESDAHNRIRLRALYLLRQGKTVYEAAQTVGVHGQTVRQWVAWYRLGGIEEVRRHRRGRYVDKKPEPEVTVDEQATFAQLQVDQPQFDNTLILQTKSEPKVHTHYQLEAEESLPDGIKRIVQEQIDRAMWQLTDPPESRDKGVHDARKCFKKIRAVLRLVRDEIGEEIFKQENACYRNAGRRLAAVRESAILIQTFDNICGRFADQLAPNAFAGARDELEAIHQATYRKIIEDESVVAEVVDTLQTARLRIADWPVMHDDFSAQSDGLRRVYRRGRNRMADAYAAPSPESFHEWRKRLKYLWYHMRILKHVWFNQLKTLVDELDEMAERLGDAHDLAELRLVILARPEMFRNQGELQVLVALTEYWQHELEAAARPLGERIYVERPRAFVNRIAAYWQTWQAEMGGG